MLQKIEIDFRAAKITCSNRDSAIAVIETATTKAKLYILNCHCPRHRFDLNATPHLTVKTRFLSL